MQIHEKDLGIVGGKPFWIGSVSLLDGTIEEVHSYREAKGCDFHHSRYFSQAQCEKIRAGACTAFWIEDGEIKLDAYDSLDEPAAVHLTGRIRSQITLLTPEQSASMHAKWLVQEIAEIDRDEWYMKRAEPHQILRITAADSLRSIAEGIEGAHPGSGIPLNGYLLDDFAVVETSMGETCNVLRQHEGRWMVVDHSSLYLMKHDKGEDALITHLSALKTRPVDELLAERFYTRLDRKLRGYRPDHLAESLTTPGMEYAKAMLKDMHDTFVEVYRGDSPSSLEHIMAPAVIRGRATGELGLGIISLSIPDGCEQTGMVHLTPKGVIDTNTGELASTQLEYIEQHYYPYDYWPTVRLPDNHHRKPAPEGVEALLQACREEPNPEVEFSLLNL